MPAQSLSCPRPSRAFRSPSTARLIDGAPQPNERLRQPSFDHSFLNAQVLGDLLQTHSGEAMEDEDIPTASGESPDRMDENPALAFFLNGLRWWSTHRSVPTSVPIAASTALRRSEMT